MPTTEQHRKIYNGWQGLVPSVLMRVERIQISKDEYSYITIRIWI